LTELKKNPVNEKPRDVVLVGKTPSYRVRRGKGEIDLGGMWGWREMQMENYW
jgi:hypothetical protein